MASRPTRRKFRLAVVDRAGLAAELEGVARERGWAVEVVPCSSALEIVGDSGPGQLGGLVVSVAASGPFLMDLLRWTESSVQQRIPTLVFGSGRPEDEAAHRMILGREHVRWVDHQSPRDQFATWLEVALEVHEVRAFRGEHDTIAQALREARMQLFHGFITQYAPDPESPPCGPPLPTSIEEIQPLRDARTQFERAHIQAAVREWGSLKDASAALGISYTSLWRRLR
jgi:hypothetical protein